MTFKEFITVLILASYTDWLGPMGTEAPFAQRQRRCTNNTREEHGESHRNADAVNDSHHNNIARSVAAERHLHRRHFHYSHLDAIL